MTIADEYTERLRIRACVEITMEGEGGNANPIRGAGYRRQQEMRGKIMRYTVCTLVLLSIILGSGSSLGADVERREIGSLVIENIPEIPEPIIERMFQYQNTRSAYIDDWAPEGKGMLISTRFGDTNQLHFLERPGGARRQITFFLEPVSQATMCPDPSRKGFLFTKDVGGGEFYQVFYFDMESGEYSILTDGTSLHGEVIWSNRGDRFAYFSTQRNGRDWDVFVGDPDEPGGGLPVLEEGGTWWPVDWSPDDRRLLVTKYVSITDSYYYIVDVETREITQVNPTEEKISYGESALWARDGKGVYLTSDEGSEFRCLKYYDLKSRTFTDLAPEIPWNVNRLEINDQGDKLAFTINEGGISKLYILDTVSRKYREVPGIPVGRAYGLSFHPDGERLALVLNTPQTPSDIYVLDLEDDSLERWTYSEVGGLNTDSFIMPELIHYETFDQVDGKPRMISAFYYRPKTGSRPFPVLLDIHGGPESQFVPYFRSTLQFYLNELGIAVIAPNVRGSSGYGKSYVKLDNGYLREDSVRDIGSLLDWIEKQPELDPSRVAVIGGSYGGYMVLASMTHYNDRLRCAIDIVGISNFVTFLENTKDYRRDLRRVEYGDERDPEMREFLNRISPTTNAHKITKPMFVVQGLNDPRVPVGEAEQIVEAIRKNGGEVWYLLAKDEGHGFAKKKNRDFYTHSIVLFLEEYLLK
jgi:dipeptidyl aminopeptidase/acylaminoacyl peptidase